jgi:hypothetical protein
MERSTIQHAVDRLQTEGKTPSVRAILGITGGSSRDVHRILKDIANGVEEEDVDEEAQEEESPPADPVSQAQETLRAANVALVEAENHLIDVVARAQTELGVWGSA